MRFAITGYPRSGHGWLANYLYKNGSVVSHEGPLSFMRPSRTVRQAHVAAMHALTGDCGSSWLLFPDLLRIVPRVVVIERPLSEVIPSFRRVMGDHKIPERETFRELEQGFKAALELHPFVLPYEKNYSLRTVERICKYVDEPFDLVRYTLLRHTRVLQDTQRILDQASE